MSLAFRAFFALPTDIATSEDRHQRAARIRGDVALAGANAEPRALAVAFDLSAARFAT